MRNRASSQASQQGLATRPCNNVCNEPRNNDRSKAQRSQATKLAERDTAICDRRIKRFGYVFDPLGGFAERGCNRRLRRFVAIGNRDLGVLQSRELFFESSDAQPGLGKFVGDGNCRHHRQPRVAYLTEFGPQIIDAIIELAREIHQMAFLAILAGHPELSAIERYADLGHSL